MANSLGLVSSGLPSLPVERKRRRKRYIPKILSAEEIWCQGFSEPTPVPI